MKYRCYLKFEVDPDIYHDVPDTNQGVYDLVNDMVNRRADFPGDMTIVCENEVGEILTKKFQPW